MLRSGLFGVLAVLAMSTAPVAAAKDASSRPEPAPGAEAPARWLLGAGFGMAFGLTDREEGYYDSWAISSLTFAELTLEPMVLVAPRVSVGVRGSWGFEIGSRALETTGGERIEQGQYVWQLAPAARYQAEPGRGLYLCANVGIAGITDTLGEQSVTQVAPMLSAALGFDLHVSGPVSLGLELRATHAMFSEEGDRLSLSEPDVAQDVVYRYGPTSWLGLSLLGRFLL